MLHLHKTNKKKINEHTHRWSRNSWCCTLQRYNSRFQRKNVFLNKGTQGQFSGVSCLKIISFKCCGRYFEDKRLQWSQKTGTVLILEAPLNRRYPQTNMLTCFPGELLLLPIYAEAFHSFSLKAGKSHTIRRPVENTRPRSALERPLDYLCVRWKRWDARGKFQNAFWHQVSDYE